MENFVVRLRHDGGVVAIKTSASDWTQAVKQCLDAELAPPSAFVNCYRLLRGGEVVWNGAKISEGMAQAYNRANDHIHAWKALGKEPPEHLLNGRHNILASVQ